MDRQLASKDLSVPNQVELPLIRPASSAVVAPEIVQAQKDMVAALNLAANVSGLEDKEIYVALDIDPGHWSRIRKGDAHFPLNKLEHFCEVVGNDILLEYFAWRRRKGLYMLETEAERQLRVANDALTKEREKSAMLADLLQGRTPR